MPVSKTEREQMYTYAISQIRFLGTQPDGTPNASLKQITGALQARFGGRWDVTAQDSLSVAKSALGGREIGRRLTDNPDDRRAALAKDYSTSAHIDRRRGDYEYRVVVRLTSGSQHFETLVVVRSRSRMTGSEIMDEAQTMVMRQEGTARVEEYRTRIRELGPAPTPQSWIVSAVRNPG